MTDDKPSAFWDDLNENLKDPEFRRLYLEETERVSIYDASRNDDSVYVFYGTCDNDNRPHPQRKDGELCSDLCVNWVPLSE